MKESLVEKKLRLAVEEAGGRCFKLPANLYRGITDRLVILPMGRVFFVELKTEGARTEPAVRISQIAFRTFLQSIGFIPEVLIGIKGVERFVREQIGKQL